ncbi:hemerythrin domain-containing protein [Jatrophihabitans fulvus]
MTATSEPDVIEVLTGDHRDVLELLGRIVEISDADLRRDLADTVIAELVRHSVAEEMFVYPAIRAHVPDGAQQVEHDIEEHQRLEAALKAWEGVDPTDAEFDECARTVTELLRHHAADEENTQFPQLREALSQEDLSRLGDKVSMAKMAAPTRPHPASPHAALFHKTVGPGVGLVDKLRDALSGRDRNV